MPKITFQEAKDFLNNINEKDNIAIIHHDDGDGFASGIILYDHCLNKKAKVEHFTFTFKEWDKSTDFAKFNKILITDIAPDGYKEINPPENKEILYLDHHPNTDNQIPTTVKIFREAENLYIPSSRTVEELTNIKPWLALAGSISDAADKYQENDQYMKQELEKLNMTLKEFKENVTHIITNSIIYFGDNTKKTFQILQKINSIQELQKLKEYSKQVEDEIQKNIEQFEKEKEKIGNINYFYLKPTRFATKGIIINIISKNNPEEIFAFATSKGNYVSISTRHQSDKANLPDLLEKATKRLEDSTSGGHLKAAAANIRKEDLEKFKQNLRELQQN